MPTDSDRFWQERQNAAKFKHHVVKNQLGAFSGKAGSTATDHRVAFLDGYAGPGSYGSGEPGSPQLAVDVADSQAAMRNVDGYFIEYRKKHATALRRMLDARGYPNWVVRRGTCDEHLPGVLEEIGECPLLVFLDPYGLGIPFESFVTQVLGRPIGSGWGRRRKTEVLLHFTISGLNRQGGFLDKVYDVEPAAAVDEPELVQSMLSFDEEEDEEQLDEAAERDPKAIARLKNQQAKSLAAMDDFLGGTWWHELKRSGLPDWHERVLERWSQQVSERTGGKWWIFPVKVPQRWDGPPAYYLVLLTQSEDGVWEFIEGVSLAYQKLYEETWEPPPAGTLFDVDGTVQTPPDLGPGYVRDIADNIRRFVAQGRSGPVIRNLPELYGSTLGRARRMHLLKALKVVHGENLLSGEFPKAKTLKNYNVAARPPA